MEDWHAIIGAPTYADAILYRLVHDADRLNLSGESMRKTRTKVTEKAAALGKIFHSTVTDFAKLRG